MTVSEICNILNDIAPIDTCLDFDNVGLLVGDYDKDIKKMLISLDLTYEVLDEAINQNVDFILTHHPLIFSPLKKVTSDTIVGGLVLKLIKNDINYYASHTNLDKSMLGTNMLLANKLSLYNTKFIEDNSLICVIGDTNISLSDIILKIKKELNIDFIRLIGDNKEELILNKIAISTGSGDSTHLFNSCKENGVELLITGDLKYHTMQYAKDIGLLVIDASHFYTENIISRYLKEILEKKLDNVEIIISKNHKNIFKTL